MLTGLTFNYNFKFILILSSIYLHHISENNFRKHVSNYSVCGHFPCTQYASLRRIGFIQKQTNLVGEMNGDVQATKMH